MECQNFAGHCTGTPHRAADREERRQLGEDVSAEADRSVKSIPHGGRHHLSAAVAPFEANASNPPTISAGAGRTVKALSWSFAA